LTGLISKTCSISRRRPS